jgi:NAD(P)-dependent dehydrogenase (short-subunit alcohol dehydrogenase family)
MATSGICEGRVVIVTGGGRGLGRSHCLEFARQGAAVVVNDFGGGLHGEQLSDSPAHAVVAEIETLGGTAVANHDDVSAEDGAARLVNTALDRFGRLDTLVNNAGILRDRMLVNMTVDDWDAVIRVHLRSTFLTTQLAANHWRSLAKIGTPAQGRILNTSSPAGLYGNIGQANYVAAKAGIAALTISAAQELGNYGVTVNAIAPVALTRMTEDLPALADDVKMREAAPDAFLKRDPANVSPLVAWLGSDDSADVTGRVFQVEGGQIAVVDGFIIAAEEDAGRRREPAEVGVTVRGLLGKVRPPAALDGHLPTELQR